MNRIAITRTITSLVLAGVTLLSCEPQLDVPTPQPGNADFSRYVAVGNSLTAGVADNGLYRAGQLNSFPRIVAQQMQAVGGGEFRQPLFPENQANGTGYLKLTGFTAIGLPILTPVAPQAVRGTTTPHPLYNPAGVLFTKYTDPIDNYGVPGIRLSDITDPNYAAKNPFYERLLTDTETNKTYLAKVAESNPTFFSSWLGNNDALQFAASGGVVPLTPRPAFQQLYALLINTLTQNGAKGAVANIPSVTSIPFLTTITLNVIRARTAGTPLANASLLIRTGAGAVRAATANDLITLTADSIGVPNSAGLPKGFHPNYPLNNEDVLDAAEVMLANEFVIDYNTAIKSIADSKGLAFVDANALLQRLQLGVIYNGVNVTGAFISGGLFSLDGVHLTPRGYAITANEFIKAINAKYGSSIPQVDVNNYPGVQFP